MKAGYNDIPTAAAVTGSAQNNKKYDSIGSKEVEDWTKGEVQPPEYRDVWFGVAFWIQIVVFVSLAAMYHSGALESDFYDIVTEATTEEGGMGRRRFLQVEDSGTITGIWGLCAGILSAFILAPILTIMAFSVLYRNAAWLISTSIMFSIGINVIIAIATLFTGMIPLSLFFFAAAGFTACYAKAVWSRIPYAAANVKTAVSSIQAQVGVAFLGLFNIPIYVAWWCLWMYVFLMTIYTPFMQNQVVSTSTNPSTGEQSSQYTPLWYCIVFLLTLSLYWTLQVLKNVIEATIAGTVGTWWFVPEEATGNGGCCGCCSEGTCNSLQRSLTYSFGSICFGSLLVAIIQTLKSMAEDAERQSRSNGENALLACILKVILGCLESIIEYFNKWAFIYVGLYGYSYIDAGKNVITLFKQRGWTALISDNLTARALGMLSFGIGLSTAIIGTILAAIFTPKDIGGEGDPDGITKVAIVSITCFFTLIVGLCISSIILGVISSAVDTIIVLFAEAPQEFATFHPELSAEMNSAWNDTYPDLFSPVAATPVGTASSTTPLASAMIV